MLGTQERVSRPRQELAVRMESSCREFTRWWASLGQKIRHNSPEILLLKAVYTQGFVQLFRLAVSIRRVKAGPGMGKDNRYQPSYRPSLDSSLLSPGKHPVVSKEY